MTDPQHRQPRPDQLQRLRDLGYAGESPLTQDEARAICRAFAMRRQVQRRPHRQGERWA